MSWVKDLIGLVQSVATLTKDAERASSEIKELRKDVNELTLAVNGLISQMQHEKERSSIILDSYKNEITLFKEANAAKFQVLTTMLDQKLDGFESRIAAAKPKSARRRAIESGEPKKS